jgi:cyclin G-associated kinase
VQVENLLIDSQGFVKLCDFGSATTDTYEVNSSWTAAKRANIEDEMSRHTTPMYRYGTTHVHWAHALCMRRSPEMLDTYFDYPIGPALDVWALGCILYYLCYRRHPFEDSAKLRIVNAKYTLPEAETPFTIFHDIIGKRRIACERRKRLHYLQIRVFVLTLVTDHLSLICATVWQQCLLRSTLM